MRKIRDVLRLRLGEHLSFRQVAVSLAIPHTTVADFVRRSRGAGITSWPLPEELGGDDALVARLFGPPTSSPSLRPEPDFEALNPLAREVRLRVTAPLQLAAEDTNWFTVERADLADLLDELGLPVPEPE